MAALKLDMTIPLGNAGHVHLVIDVGDISALSAHQRAILADTGREFYDFAAKTLADIPELIIAAPAAAIHDPSASVLNGVTGSRIRDKL